MSLRHDAQATTENPFHFSRVQAGYATAAKGVREMHSFSFSMDERGVSVREAFAATIGIDIEPVRRITLLVQGVVTPYGETSEGKLIKAVAVPWKMIVQLLKENPRLAFEIPPHGWEVLVAAAFDYAGYDEVILTPRSGDRGRDVIAIKKGVGAIRIIDSVKAYKPGHLVRHDDVRALLGVLSGDLQTSKGIITTTSDFAPNIIKDPYISRFIPYRLELMNGEQLQRWLQKLAGV